MPIFDYDCVRCGAFREVLVKSAEENVQCECGLWMRKLVSSPNFALKGTGWYKTDFGGKPSDSQARHANEPWSKPPSGDSFE